MYCYTSRNTFSMDAKMYSKMPTEKYFDGLGGQLSTNYYKYSFFPLAIYSGMPSLQMLHAYQTLRPTRSQLASCNIPGHRPRSSSIYLSIDTASPSLLRIMRRDACKGIKVNQRTNGPVNAHLRSAILTKYLFEKFALYGAPPTNQNKGLGQKSTKL